MNHRLRPVLAVAGLIGATMVLHRAATTVASPPLDPTVALTWWTGTDPLEAFVGTARLLALAVCYWLIAVTALDLVAGAVRARPLERLTVRLVPAAWRTLVLRPLAATVVVAPQVMVPVATMSTVAAAPDPIVTVADDETSTAEADGPLVLEMRRSGPPSSPLETSPGPAQETEESEPDAPSTGEPDHVDPHPSDAVVEHDQTEDLPMLTMRSGRGADVPPHPEPAPAPDSEDTNDEELVDPSTSHRDPAASESPPVMMQVPDAAPHTPPEGSGLNHVVAPGEHLWAIAEARLTSAGQSPSAAEIVPYWQDLIALNRSALPDAANPDLLLPGIELQLPPIS